MTANTHEKILEVRGLTKTYGGVKKKGAKPASWTGNTVMRQLSRGHLTGICYPEYLSVPQGGQH